MTESGNTRNSLTPNRVGSKGHSEMRQLPAERKGVQDFQQGVGVSPFSITLTLLSCATCGAGRGVDQAQGSDRQCNRVIGGAFKTRVALDPDFGIWLWTRRPVLKY